MCKCSVQNCQKTANYLVLLVDYYAENGDFFVEIDKTCPLLCTEHKDENEKQAQGERKARMTMSYPYTIQEDAQGITEYISLKTIERLLKENKETTGLWNKLKNKILKIK